MTTTSATKDYFVAYLPLSDHPYFAEYAPNPGDFAIIAVFWEQLAYLDNNEYEALHDEIYDIANRMLPASTDNLDCAVADAAVADAAIEFRNQIGGRNMFVVWKRQRRTGAAE